jgi:hypothetical protein
MIRQAFDSDRIIQQGRSFHFPWQVKILVGLVCHEILTYFLQGAPMTLRNVIYLDFQKLEMWKERLLRYPECPECGDSRLSSPWNMKQTQEGMPPTKERP